MEVPPISVFSSEPFADVYDYAATFREAHPEQWHVRDGETGEPVAFATHIHTNFGKPKSQVVMCRKKHPPVPMAEKVGPKWDRLGQADVRV